MGQIIELGEHKWELPDVPNDPSEILFYNKKKADQFWVRDNSFPDIFYDYHHHVKLDTEETEYDDDGNLIALSKTDTKVVMDLQAREIYRRVYGIYFMNFGVPTYLTGGHYFQLQWGAIPGFTNKYDGSEYGYYLEFQAKVHYFLKMCKDDEECGGGYIGKAKKTGLSLLISLDYLNETTLPMFRGKRFLMMSKTEDDCKDTNYMYYTNALDRLPVIFVPDISKRNETVVQFNVPLSKSSGTLNSALKQKNRKAGFNTEMSVKATVANAFDGPVVFRGVLDEIAKYPKANSPEKVFTKSSESVKIGNTINGKLWLFCYPPETDDDQYREAKKIWYDSALKTKDPITLRTLTGLYQYFVSSLDSEGKYIDKYGKCDHKATKRMHDASLNQRAHDPQKVQAYNRQYPQYADQMWEEGGGGGSKFDNIRLGKRKHVIEEQHRIAPSYEAGSFKWAGLPYQSLVQWVPLTDAEILAGKQGSFRWYYKEVTDFTQLNIPMQRVLDGVDAHPQVVKLSPFGGAWDPSDYIGKKDVAVGSKHAGIVGSMPDIARNTKFGKVASNIVHMVYLDRHNNPDDDMMNMIFMMLYWGCPFYIEGNKPWMTTTIHKNNLESFLMVREAKKGIVPYNKFVHTTSPQTTKNLIEDYCNLIAIYISWDILKEDVDYLQYLEDERIISDLMQFDTEATKKYDLGVTFGLWRIMMESLKATLSRRMAAMSGSQYDALPDAMRVLVGAKMPERQHVPDNDGKVSIESIMG